MNGPFPRIIGTKSSAGCKNSNEALAKASDGKSYLYKKPFRSADPSSLFKQCFAHALGLHLELPFSRWTPLVCDSDGSSLMTGTRREELTFGWEAVAHNSWKDLPVNNFTRISNSLDAYKCLLFDLWCNSSETRQILWQHDNGHFKIHFPSHHGPLATSVGFTSLGLLERCRCQDLRVYYHHPTHILDPLYSFAADIRSITANSFGQVLSTIPACWMDTTHVAEVTGFLTTRYKSIHSYVQTIHAFSERLAGQSVRRSALTSNSYPLPLLFAQPSPLFSTPNI